MNNLLAALMFFTRLPFHKIQQVPADSFSHVTGWWSVTGWLTGGVMALVFWLCSKIMIEQSALVLALLSRVLLTGALHEDGLADFLDGFGGSNDKESTLRIMKDSHIGTYGVLGLILYFLLSYTLLLNVQIQYMPVVLICGDVFCKCVSSHIVYFLPYARPETESKNRTVYTHPTALEQTLTLVSGFGALMLMPWAVRQINAFFPLVFPLIHTTLPVAVFFLLIWLFKRRLNGYTGDCCGALFLLTELAFRLMTAIF